MRKPINLAIVIEGGVVSAIVSDDVGHFEAVRVMVIDYDVEGSDAADNPRIFDVIQGDGSQSRAWASDWELDVAAIDLRALATALDARE